jgi:hypothetical protein
MPLLIGSSPEVVQANIRELRHMGYSEEDAMAIARAQTRMPPKDIELSNESGTTDLVDLPDVKATTNRTVRASLGHGNAVETTPSGSTYRSQTLRPLVNGKKPVIRTSNADRMRDLSK